MCGNIAPPIQSIELIGNCTTLGRNSRQEWLLFASSSSNLAVIVGPLVSGLSSKGQCEYCTKLTCNRSGLNGSCLFSSKISRSSHNSGISPPGSANRFCWKFSQTISSLPTFNPENMRSYSALMCFPLDLMDEDKGIIDLTSAHT